MKNSKNINIKSKGIILSMFVLFSVLLILIPTNVYANEIDIINIGLEETNFLSDKTKDQFRSLYRLIAERIRQYQNISTKSDLDKFQKPKN